MKKSRPTDFSQITLLSNQKAKLIYLKNSKENNEHLKLCKSFELAKHGIKASHGKEKKDLEKRLERHYQDSLNVDDIKCLRKFVGDARDEGEFCSQFFESGRARRRSRSFSVGSYNKKGHLDTASSNLGEPDLGMKNMESVPNEQTQLQTNFPKQDSLNHSTYMPRMKEKELNTGSFAERVQAGNHKHTRSCPEEMTYVKISQSRSPKVQRENIVKQNRNEMLSGLTASLAKPDIVSLRMTLDTNETSKENVFPGAEASENFDENNNCLEGKIWSQEENNAKVDSENQEKKVSDTETLTDVEQSNMNCDSKESGNGIPFGQQICEPRKDSKKGPVVLKRLGPTPNECEEDIEDGIQDENGAQAATGKQHSKESATVSTQANDVRNSIEKSREMFPVGNGPPVRRRRSSWAGPRSIPERLFKREFAEALPHLGRTYEVGNGVGRPGLDNSDKASQKSFETASNDDCASSAGEHFEAMKRSMSFQKSNSVPLIGLGRPKIYSEEPFYMRPRRLTRRPSWQSTKLSEDTVKGLADKSKSDNDMMMDEPEPETPLVSILPPITLQSIYAQECSKEKREKEFQERKRDTYKKMGEGKGSDLDVSTGRLKDCRYLRFKKDPNLS